VLLASVPVMVACVLDATPRVFTVNVAVVAPLGTVTLEGTVALVLLEESETDAPPDGAGPFNVTVPVELFPPTTEVGLSETPDKVAGTMVKVAV